MIFYSCVFSLEGSTDISYIHMLMILYKSLVFTKSLTDKDIYYVMADKETIKLIAEIELLKQIVLIPMPTPKTVMEGMCWRYQLHRQMDILGKTVCYMDVDMLNIRPFNFNFTDDKDDDMLVYPEGANDDRNYSFTGSPLAIPYGVTSGFFACKYGPKVLQFMEEVYYNIKRASVKHYTLDQVHFNKAIEGKDFISYMPDNIVSFNGNNNKDTAVFINCCGEPGNGTIHLTKMLQFVLN